MKLIVGLGNPGAEYAQTRHNIGFMAVDRLVDELKLSWKMWGQGSNCEIAQGSIKGEKVLIQKPLTYMNLSGQAVVGAAHFFKILPEDIVALHDDLDLPFGDVRLKVGGGDGGNNGLKSLTKHLSTGEYARIRMGIGRPSHPDMDPSDFVLSPFGKADWTMVEDMVQRAIRAIDAFAAGPQEFQRAMSSMNRARK
jgi:PTH1 family peptidyl-tRNA hydrolase